MAENPLVKIFEHNNWANAQIIQACMALSAEQLDAAPPSATEGSIRHTLLHLVLAQHEYMRLLTLPLAERPVSDPEPPWAEVAASAEHSGAALVAVLKDEASFPRTPLRTRDGHWVEPWVLIMQIINHATEHREQIKSMLSALGITPPNIDGWEFGWVTKAMVPVS
jgi:uncharacterized damage-inducible protein DinB